MDHTTYLNACNDLMKSSAKCLIFHSWTQCIRDVQVVREAHSHWILAALTFNTLPPIFIYSGFFHSASSVPYTTVSRSRHSTYTLSEFHAEAPQATASEELAVAAREGFEPATLRTKGAESTNEPPRPTHHLIL